ncbi:Pentatricopeptide repeat [Dillenia turbinata]|uniref:Pentatricopeptide repeat n=1 Tax=Dillenia turbinata TaxID=194707 RepID=A0AAN8Z1H7_9MAGN
MFDEIPIKNLVCWTALISAYVDDQKPNMALQLFRKMQMDNIEPDHVSITVALTACADLGALDMGEWIHAYLQSKELVKADLSLHNALINMYAKCGDIITARRLFDGLVNKDVTTWTSMIVGHALHGQAGDALELFAKMTKNKKMGNRRNATIFPNDVTFIGVLMACGHAGMVEEGKQHFKSMSEVYGLKPRNSHFGCMVDLFCRAGLIKEAYEFILEMPICPNAVVWRTLLGACGLHGNIELGKEVQCKLHELESSYAGDFVAISNIYAARGMWDEKTSIRDLIAQRRAPGCSSIEVGSGINEFVAADNDHPMKGDIYEILQNLTRNMKAYGYAPKASSQTEC